MDARASEEVVGLLDFAGGVAGHGQFQLIGFDAATIVGHPHQVHSAGRHGDVDPRGAGVDGVFHQFFDDAGRPFDHLARGDLVDQALRKGVDAGHGAGEGGRG